MEAFILSAVEQGVMTITLNRPDRLNSFNDLMHHQLAECLKQAERDDGVRCLLITGAGRGFCAGQDLNDRNVDPSGPPPDLGMSVERFYNPLVRRLAALPKPVICAVNGVAAGAGATLALGCDIVLAARSAKFVMAFSKLGLVPDCGGSWFLPRVAGRARAMGLALLGDSLSAEQAAQWGIIWQLVDDSELADTSLQLARHLAAQPTFGLGLIKKALLASETNSLDAQLAFKIDAFLALSSAMMAESSEGLPEADKSIITRCVEAAYARCSGGEGMPTLSDFHEILVEQPEVEARDIALRYERYVTGALSFFNRQSNVGFHNRITNIDLHDLSTNMRVFGMLTALEAVRNRMYANFERGVTTWLYIDEVQSLFGHPTIIDYFAKFWAEGRKFNLICTGISQNTSHMLTHERARTMVLNSDFMLLHKQASQDLAAWAEMLSLSSAEREYIDESIKAGEGLLVAGGARVPIRDDFPKGALYDLWNTKPEEIAQLKRAHVFEKNAKRSKN